MDVYKRFDVVCVAFVLTVFAFRSILCYF